MTHTTLKLVPTLSDEFNIATFVLAVPDLEDTRNRIQRFLGVRTDPQGNIGQSQEDLIVIDGHIDRRHNQAVILQLVPVEGQRGEYDLAGTSIDLPPPGFDFILSDILSDPAIAEANLLDRLGHAYSYVDQRAYEVERNQPGAIRLEVQGEGEDVKLRDIRITRGNNSVDSIWVPQEIRI